MRSQRLPSIVAAVAVLAFAAISAYAVGPYTTLDTAATARATGNNGTSTAAYLAADAQTAAVPTATLLPMATNTAAAPTATTTSSSGPRTIPSPQYSVTLDDVSNLSGIVAALRGHSRMPTVRIVFDKQNQPSYYAAAITQIHPIAYIVGTLLDSTDLPAMSPSAVTARAQSYLAAFGDQIDAYEILNEGNGEWLCPGGSCSASETTDVVAKMTSMYDTIHNAGKKTFLTLSYNGLTDANNCYSQSSALMMRWARVNVPARMLTGLDMVGITYYEDVCPSTATTSWGVSKDWNTVFTQLHDLFPNSGLMFGEVGTTNANAPLAQQQAVIAEYYSISLPNVPNYIPSGYFWYYAENCVPSSKPLWTYLDNAFKAMPSH